jgi:N-methylhydantoinase A
MVDIHTVGAGGGSIAWRDPGGALRVGPRSAGADPGPACYGRGGTEPTVTDANLVLGLLDAGNPLAGGVALDREAAERAIDSLGLDDAAEGIVRVANAEMLRALRVMTVERGVDPRDFALLAFGGAGGLHACALASELGMQRVLVPRASGVLSALGLAAADRRVDVQRTVLGRDYDVDDLRAEAVERLGGDAVAEVAYDCRYEGQSFELTVADPDVFPRVHEERYGFREDGAAVEVVTVRVTARLPGPEVTLAGDVDAVPAVETRETALGATTSFVRGDLPPGFDVEGPAVLALPEATVAVPAGWSGRVDDGGTVVLDGPR